MSRQTSFGWVDGRCRQTTGPKGHILGGKSIILIGDICQLPPVTVKILYHKYPASDTGEQGYFLHHLFYKVFCLTTNQDVKGSDATQHMFRNFLRRLRNGESNYQDWEILLTCQLSAVENIDDFKHATRLFFAKTDVAKSNNDKLFELGNPVAQTLQYNCKKSKL